MVVCRQNPDGFRNQLVTKSISGGDHHETSIHRRRRLLQHGLGLKDANGVEKDGGTVKFRKVEIKPLEMMRRG